MEQIEQNEPSESPIDIREYIYLFRSWAWLIVLAGLLAGVAAYIVSTFITPVYEASTRLLVSVPATISGFDYTALVSSQTMTSTYAEMLLDRPVLEGVIDQLELHITPKDLKKTISVDVVTNTQLLVVTVENTDPALAAAIANETATVFTDRIRQLQSQRFAVSLDGLAKQVSDMEGQITETNNQIASTTDPEKLQQLEDRLTQYRTIYSNLVTNYEQVRLAEEQNSTNVVVSEPANVPSIPVRPKTFLYVLLSVGAAMLVAAIIVVGRYAFDDTIKNPEEIRKNFNLPILGVINSHKALEDKPITLTEPRSPTAEAFRSLRTNITFASVEAPLRRILITSPTEQDGKTTIASNLAVVLAQAEKKTLLMDADLRCPTIQTHFGLPNHIGLTELFLRPSEDLSSVIQRVDGLAVITSGVLPPNPSELLTSKTIGQILERFDQIFDLIVINSPPVLTVTDTAALAPSMDGVILVVKPGRTKMNSLQQALEQFRTVGARVLGLVLSEVNPASRKYGYYYNRYYSKYSHYYERDNIKEKKNGRKK